MSSVHNAGKKGYFFLGLFLFFFLFFALVVYIYGLNQSGLS